MVFQHQNLGIGIHTAVDWSLFLGLSVTRARIHTIISNSDSESQSSYLTSFILHLYLCFSTGELILFDSEDDEIRKVYNHSFALPHLYT